MIEQLPKAGLPDVATRLQRYFRPGTHRSPLRRLRASAGSGRASGQ